MLKKINVGINCLSFDVNKKNGALEVLMNLARGWGELQYDSSLTFFCYKEHEKEIASLCPNAKIVIFENRMLRNHRELASIGIQTFLFHSIYKKYDLNVIFFALTSIGLFKYKIPVVLIPHDIQMVAHPENYLTNSLKDKLVYLFNYLEYKRNFKLSDKIIAISNVDQVEIETHYPFTNDKMIKIYNPISKVVPDTINIIKKEYIIAVNIQYEHKNIITLIKAFELFHNRRPQYKLILVGKESKATQKLRNYINKHNLEECIEFLGFIPNEELNKLWSDAALYINPSIYEGFGMTSVESLMLGVPTLLSDIPINREVTDNLAYYFKDLYDYQKLANTIESIINKPLKEEIVKEISMAMYKKYNYLTISQQYWNTFKMAIDKTLY